MSAQSKLILRWAAVFLLVAILLGGLVGRAQAVEIDRNGYIPAGTTIDDDLVVAATTVTMDGTINGNLIAAGNTVTINGTVKSDVIAAASSVVLGENAVVEGNLFVGGSNLDIRGKVDGSIFGGAGSMVLEPQSSVTRNVYFGGFDLTTMNGSKIGKDLYAGTYQTIFNGSARNIGLAAAAIEINGTVNGDAELRLAETNGTRIEPFNYWTYNLPAPIKPGLRISSTAKIAGKLIYTSQTNQSATILTTPEGGTIYQTPVPSQTTRVQRTSAPQFNFPFTVGTGFWLWALLRNLVTILILGALALWLAPSIFRKSLAQLQQRALASMGVGLLALIVVLFAIPMVAIGLVMLSVAFGLVTLVDMAFIIGFLGFSIYGLALVLFFTLFLWGGKLLVSFIIGAWILSKLTPQSNPQPFWTLALGAVIFALLAAIPIAGFLFTFLVDLAGAGALWYAWRTRS